MKEKLPEVYFGKVTEVVDWRKYSDDYDPDDVELAVTDPEIVMILGFDPKEFSKG